MRAGSPPPDANAGDIINGRPFYPIKDSIPLGSMGMPRDTGELAAFLASDKGSHITGTIIRVDGGLTLPGQLEWFAPLGWMDKLWA